MSSTMKAPYSVNIKLLPCKTLKDGIGRGTNENHLFLVLCPNYKNSTRTVQ